MIEAVLESCSVGRFASITDKLNSRFIGDQKNIKKRFCATSNILILKSKWETSIFHRQASYFKICLGCKLNVIGYFVTFDNYFHLLCFVCASNESFKTGGLDGRTKITCLVH